MREEVMEKPYPLNLQDLFNSDVRVRIFEVVCLQQETFSTQDIVDELAKNGFTVRRSVVQSFLHILHIRNYLTGFEYRQTHRRGRFGMRYQLREAKIR